MIRASGSGIALPLLAAFALLILVSAREFPQEFASPSDTFLSLAFSAMRDHKLAAFSRAKPSQKKTEGICPDN